jgi:hypothetical protein
MSNFAVLDKDNTIVNIIVAENLSIAETCTQAICIPYADETQIHIGGKYLGDGKFEAPDHLKPLTQAQNDEIAAEIKRTYKTN